MAGGSTTIEAGAVSFALQYRDNLSDQGVCIHVMGDVDGTPTELLRFDCFDQEPHYHYAPTGKNQRIFLDKTTAGNPLGWTLRQLRTKLPAMLEHGGFDELASKLDGDLVASKLDEVETVAREMALTQRAIVIHGRGKEVIEAGNVRFGLEYRHVGQDEGLTIHVMGDVAGQEIELLAFDCFQKRPHYHYGPRNQNIRLYWDTTLVPDTLDWTLGQFKGGRLPAMLERAGYPTIASSVDRELLADVLAQKVDPTARSMYAEGQK